jgi:zinc/manganese transport system ATP-binding protein
MNASPDQFALSVQNAQLAFGDRAIWSDLNFEVKPGEFIAVIGANGSGKSSLLKCILGQQQLTSGSITLGNHQRARGGETIGYIPQHRAIDAELPLRVEDAVTRRRRIRPSPPRARTSM